jgi:hypothetical protein
LHCCQEPYRDRRHAAAELVRARALSFLDEAVMNVRDIPRAQWPAFLDHFSRTHRAWLATVESGTAPGNRSAHREDTVPHPLGSITPFVYNDYVVHVDIRFQDEDRTHDPLRVVAPGTVRVDETPEGVADVLEIVDDKGVVTRLRFRAAPKAEMLDGIAPGEFS